MRSLGKVDVRSSRVQAVEPVLLFWRRLIDHAAEEAKVTEYGIPTYHALLQRWWIEDCRPSRESRTEWETSFECACEWLGVNVDEERKRLSGEIQACLRKKAWRFAQGVAYERRAHALTCAGRPTAIARQLVLGLVSTEEYTAIRGIDPREKPAGWNTTRGLFPKIDRSRRRAA